MADLQYRGVKHALARRKPVDTSRRSPEEEWAETLRALADPTRLRILSSLGAQSLSVSQLTVATGSSQYNVSKHLRILRTHGIVQVRQEGLRRFYRIEESLLRRTRSKKLTLDFGCCVFQL